MKRIILLGATGSIGEQTLTVLRSYPEAYQLVGFAVNTSIEKAAAIMNEFGIKDVCVFDETQAQKLQAAVDIKIQSGMKGLLALTALEADVVINALVGSVGVLPTIAALETQKDVALANKETLVMAGDIVMETARKHHRKILPVDSEHSAIFQCLENNYQKELRHIIITASGGSLRDLTTAEKRHATVEQVLKHPNWSMGAKITVDSATMMNKGFEVIEAHHLFDVDYDQILTVLHKESKVHSLVEYVDGSILAHLGVTDMRIPIQYALTYPERKPLAPSTAFDWTQSFGLSFEPMDFERFPLLKLAFEVGKIGHTMPAVLNAANEVVVAAFLNKEIEFYQIETILKTVVAEHKIIKNPGLDQLLELDHKIRIVTKAHVQKAQQATTNMIE